MADAEPSMEDLARKAGAGPEVTRYLQERGIRSSGTLALIATDQDHFDNIVVAPLLAGWRPEPAAPGITLDATEKPIAKAVLRFMWHLAVESRKKVSAAASAIPATTTPGVGTLGAAPSSTPDASTKTPKTLPAGEWRVLLEKYNSVLLHGERRDDFPERELLGAEAIVARVLDEHRRTKLYSPVGLGEILSRRSFQSNGEVNPLSKKSRSTKLLVEDGVLKEDAQQDDEWQPKGSLSVMDGLNSIRWCFILCEVGPEKWVHNYFDTMIKRSRTQSNKVASFKTYFEQASWRLCAALRANRTWKEASLEILADVASYQEAMLKEPAASSPSKRRFSEMNNDEATLPQISDVLVLSFFDGMGTGGLVIQELGLRIRALFTWEVDVEASKISRSLFKGLRFDRGDITADDAETVVSMISDLLRESPSHLLVLAGPPCPDFSKMAEGAGRSGATGKLFDVFCKFLRALEEGLPNQTFHIVVENVIMKSREDINYFSKTLRATPLVICASDFGLISRPRLWWTRMDLSKLRDNPVNQKPLRWGKHTGVTRLFIDPPRDDRDPSSCRA